MHYSILDFNAVLKHSYYAATNGEKIFCEETGRSYPTWKAAAEVFLTRYFNYIIEQSNPRYIIACHDQGHKLRTEIFPEYKLNRKDKKYSPVESQELTQFKGWLKGFLASVGATQIGFPDVEADDIIAWIVKNTTNDTRSVFTVDADLLQLCEYEGTVVYLKLEAHFGDGEYKGIPYKFTSFAKSMLGDTSDNYPGIKGFGPKKFEHLLTTYGEDGIKEFEQVCSKGNNSQIVQLIDLHPQDKTFHLFLDKHNEWNDMYRIAILHPELCENPRVKPIIHKRVPDAAKFSSLLTSANCEDMLEGYKDLLNDKQLLLDANNFESYKDEIYAALKDSSDVAFDYETTDKTKIESFRQASNSKNFVDVLSQELTGASFCFGKYFEYTVYIPVDHKDTANCDKQVIKDILEFCQSRKINLIAHNAFFEGVVTKKTFDLTLSDVKDTRILQRYFNENEEAGLKFLSSKYLDYTQKSYEDTVGDCYGMNELTGEEVLQYGLDDALVTAHLYDLLTLLLKLDCQYEFVNRWAVNPTMILQHSYLHGVTINWKLQKRVHQRDIAIVKDGMTELREVLRNNVSGMPTAGMLSLYELEKGYISKAAIKKYGQEDAPKKVYEWKRKLEDACQYEDYTVEEIETEVPFTATNLTKTATVLELPKVEKHTLKALTSYVAESGYLSMDSSTQQFKFVTLISEYLKDRNTEPMIAFMKEVLDLKPKIITYGDELNVGSPAQMQQLIYCKIGVPVRITGKQLGKTREELKIDHGSPSTDEIAIRTAMANDVQKGSWQELALETLLKVKSATTRISLYHEKYPMWKHVDGKIHPYFTDAGTDTRRPTGSSPNVLQVSKKDKSMREMFMPPSEDYVVVAIDYNGQELRLMACETKDPVMIDAYNSPTGEKDLHSVTGSGIAASKGITELADFFEFDCIRKDPTHKFGKLADTIRKAAKGVNFGLCYGAGASTISRNLIIPIEDAQEYLKGAFATYEQIKPWQENMGDFMVKHGYTLTAFGTKRHATNDLYKGSDDMRARQKRQGANSIIQGTAAEMLRVVLTGIAERDLINKLRMVFFAPIYDETVAFVHKDDVYEYCENLHEIMQQATPKQHAVLQQPEISIGATWGTVHECGRFAKLGREGIQKYVDIALEEGKKIWETDMK